MADAPVSPPIPPDPPTPPTPPTPAASQPPTMSTLHTLHTLNEDADVAEFGRSIADFLPPGGVSLLIAKRGAGATTLARTIAASVAQGCGFAPFWAGSGVDDDTVLFWMPGARPDPAQERWYWQSFGPPAPWQKVVTVALGMPGWDAGRTLREMIRATSGCRLVILDAVPDYRLPSARPAEPLLVLPKLGKIAYDWDIPLLAILPISRRERLTADTPHHYRLAYGVDSVLMLRDRDGTRTLTAAPHKGIAIEETILSDPPQWGNVLLRGMGRWQEAVQDARVDAIRLALLAAPSTERELEARIGGKREAIGRVLRALVANGEVIRSGGGKRGDPYRYRWNRENE